MMIHRSTELLYYHVWVASRSAADEDGRESVGEDEGNPMRQSANSLSKRIGGGFAKIGAV